MILWRTGIICLGDGGGWTGTGIYCGMGTDIYLGCCMGCWGTFYTNLDASILEPGNILSVTYGIFPKCFITLWFLFFIASILNFYNILLFS